MAIPYLPNIPQPNDQLSVSQGNLLTNFQGLNTFVNVNHVDFTSADAGKHKFASFPVQAGNPGTTATELAVYSKNSAYTASAGPQLLIQRPTNGSTVEFTSSSQTGIGWTFLPSGILLKWGNVVATSPTTTIMFPIAPGTIPAFNGIFNVQLTPMKSTSGSNLSVSLQQPAPFDIFQIFCFSTGGLANDRISYLAIGF